MQSGEPAQHVYTHPSRVENWRHTVEIVALIIAAAWGFYVFVYQEDIKPASEPAAMQITPSLTSAPIGHGKLLVTEHIVTKNIGSTATELTAALETGYGIRYGNAFGRSIQAGDGFTRDVRTLPVMEQRVLFSSIVLFRRFGTPQESFFVPGREKETGTAFAIPAGRFDAIRLEFVVCFQRMDDRHTYKYKPKRLPNGAFDPQALDDADPYLNCTYNRAGYTFPL